jgi:hypothetical protein
MIRRKRNQTVVNKDKFQTTVPTFKQSVRLWQAQYKAAKAASEPGKAQERLEGCSGPRL